MFSVPTGNLGSHPYPSVGSGGKCCLFQWPQEISASYRSARPFLLCPPFLSYEWKDFGGKNRLLRVQWPFLSSGIVLPCGEGTLRFLRQCAWEPGVCAQGVICFFVLCAYKFFSSWNRTWVSHQRYICATRPPRGYLPLHSGWDRVHFLCTILDLFFLALSVGVSSCENLLSNSHFVRHGRWHSVIKIFGRTLPWLDGE